jgi:hypothetical protein
MWSPNKQSFENVDTGAAFVACRWHELFDEFTPDTFHPKLYSLSSLAAEATMIGELHENHDAWLKHLKHVQSELIERLEHGIERTLCEPRQLGMLERLSKATSATEVVGIGRVLALEGFHERLEESVRGKLANYDIATASKKKEDADALLTSLATFAFRKGCSSDDTSCIADVLPSGGEAVRKWILDALPAQEQTFDCIIAIRTQDDHTQTAVRAVCDNAGVTRASPNIPGLPQGKDLMFLRRKVAGLRAFDAIETLKTDIRSRLNLLALYQQNAAPVILQDAWVVEANGAQLIQERSPSFRNLHPRRNAVQLADKAASALASQRSEPAIRAALDLHNLALSMTDHRLRLVNLWSALECLASLVDGDSIISRVERLVCPILSWRKPDKIARYIAISIHLWLRSNPEIDRAALPFRLGHKESVAAERILTLLTEPIHSPGIVSLMNAVSGHPLLLHRVNKAWELFHEPKHLHQNLTNSGKRLGWHLWRIYRARNLLVHQGVEPDCLPQVANHLQQYLSWTLSRLLHGLSFGEEWTGRDSWHFWKSKSEHLVSSLAAAPNQLVLEDVFPEELHESRLPVYPVAVAACA